MMIGMPRNVAYQEKVPAKPRSMLPTTSPPVRATIVGYTSARPIAMPVNSFILNFLEAVYAKMTGRK